MNAIPVSASPDAVDLITEHLLSAQEDPQYAGLIPVLCESRGYTITDEQGGFIEAYGETHFGIGWYNLEDVTECPTVALGISGLKLRVHAETLARLECKHIVLRTVKVRSKGDTRVERPMLKAIDDDS